MLDPTGAETPPEEASPSVDDAAERLPTDIAAAILGKYFTLTAGDFAEIAQCRGASSKLSFSVQLCTLRWRGHFLVDLREVPATVLEMLAAQLGLLPMPLADYAQDDKTISSCLSPSSWSSCPSATAITSGRQAYRRDR